MVIKHKEAEKILKKVQEKLTHHADYFDAEKKWSEKFRQARQEQDSLSAQVKTLAEQLKSEKAVTAEARKSKDKLEEENARLKESVEKYQNILLAKFEGSQGGNSEYSLPPISNLPASSKRVMGTPLGERTQ